MIGDNASPHIRQEKSVQKEMHTLLNENNETEEIKAQEDNRIMNSMAIQIGEQNVVSPWAKTLHTETFSIANYDLKKVSNLQPRV
mmetsp:Transcript_3903/g.7426  ORF Transcript_3903/g.7426 Transcript_3903/m.7426 type:complete len:85 (+) Transcript_3903:85-339(+)